MNDLKKVNDEVQLREADDKEIYDAIQGRDIVQHAERDEVFGELSEEGPNYRNVGWMVTSVLMIKTQIGLGVLSIPYVLATLGIVPGVISILAIAVITTWSDYVVGTFKINHPHVYGVSDVGEMLGGKIGREIAGAAYWLFMTAVVGSGLLSISIALNAVSEHGTCTAVFVAVATIITFGLASIQTLEKIGWITWVGVGSILTALFTLTISVGLVDRPALAPPTGSWEANVKIIGSPTFLEAMNALAALVFSYAGTPAFFSIIAEMRDTRKYTKSLILCQSVVTAIYLTVGIVVYNYCGDYVASPALGSAGKLIKRVAYGLALPGLLVTATIYTHLPAKWLFVRFLRNSEHLSKNSMKHWIYWLSCVAGCVLFSYVIASAVPVFGGLVGLIGALFGTVLSMQLMGVMWIYDNPPKRQTAPGVKYWLLFGWNVFIIVIGSLLMVGGTIGSIKDIQKSYAASGGTSAWSCADNSGSV